MNENRLKTAAICGLFCEGCGLYIASNEDEKRLAKIAERYKLPPEQVRCEGCRSQTLSPYCRTCKMKDCAVEKKVNFCFECNEYPCQIVKDFQAQAQVAHRMEVFESLNSIKENGYDAWYDQMRKYYSCDKCNTINSAYDITCRKCGNIPGNSYVKNHLDEIKKIVAANAEKK